MHLVLQFQNVSIPWSNTVKYLGLLLDSKLLFTKHSKTVLHKVTGIFLKIFPLHAPDSPLTIPSKILLYKHLLRSIISYAAPVWSTISQTNYRHLPVYQSKCLRVIGAFPGALPYQTSMLTSRWSQPANSSTTSQTNSSWAAPRTQTPSFIT